MPENAKHHAVAFAERYSSRGTDYLNAAAALWRVGNLLDDAETLKKYLDIVVPEDQRWAPWVGAEVVSYYAVGLVTCLEWQARSRLVDLLTFFPAAFKTDDLRVMRDKVVVETLASNVTVAAVVGAATNISTFDDYTSVFSRLFAAFGMKQSVYDVIKANNPETDAAWVEPREIEIIQNLYRFRNDLVHEIGIERVGHFNVRERWNPSEAINTIQLVQKMMRAIEASITASAPAGFPNLLDSDGLPKSELIRVEQEIRELENELSKLIDYFEDGSEYSQSNFVAANSAAASYIRSELDFIEGWPILFNRYVEMKEPLKLALVHSRQAYLKAIVETVGSVYELDGPEELLFPKSD